MFDQKSKEALSDALQTLQDALSLRREGQDTVNAIIDKTTYITMPNRVEIVLRIHHSRMIVFLLPNCWRRN